MILTMVASLKTGRTGRLSCDREIQACWSRVGTLALHSVRQRSSPCSRQQVPGRGKNRERPAGDGRAGRGDKMSAWRWRLSPIFSATLLALALVSYARATTYALSGATYDPASLFGVYTNATGISGSFTTAVPLPRNLVNAPIAGGAGGLRYVKSWSFDDGVFTYTKANSALWNGANDPASSFVVSTDSAGNITDFFIVLTMPSTGAAVGQPTEFLFLGFDGPGSFGADRSICTVVAPDGSCNYYQVTTDSASSPPAANATFSSSCRLNKKGKCRSPIHLPHS